MCMLITAHEGSRPDPEGGTTRKHSSREKSLFIGLSVSGTARVSGARGGWDVYVPLSLLTYPSD